MRIHHIGYLVKNIEKAINVFNIIGYIIEKETVYDDVRKIKICFMTKDNYRIELISPSTNDSVVSNLIKKYNNTPYHICYESDYFEEDLENLCNKGFVKIDNPCKAIAIDNKRVVFLMSSTIGIVEIIENF